MIYGSFQQFIKSVVLPMKEAHPEHKRLDGQDTVGNFDVAGRFTHHGKVWRVHADTHYKPLMIAYDAIQNGQADDPFTEVPTEKGLRLDLIPSLFQLTESPYRYMYIYEDV